MARRFSDEIDLTLTYDPEIARNSIWEAIHGDTILLVDLQGDILSGVVIGHAVKEFFKETEAYITKFHVEREFRGLGISRELIAAFEEESQAKMIWTSSIIGPTESIYTNLFKKSGYSISGRILAKEK